MKSFWVGFASSSVFSEFFYSNFFILRHSVVTPTFNARHDFINWSPSQQGSLQLSSQAAPVIWFVELRSLASKKKFQKNKNIKSKLTVSSLIFRSFCKYYSHQPHTSLASCSNKFRPNFLIRIFLSIALRRQQYRWLFGGLNQYQRLHTNRNFTLKLTFRRFGN